MNHFTNVSVAYFLSINEALTETIHQFSCLLGYSTVQKKIVEQSLAILSTHLVNLYVKHKRCETDT